MKYLIVGLGNVGEVYHKVTRHNIGFDVLDAFAKASNIVFEPARYGEVAMYKFKGRTFYTTKTFHFYELKWQGSQLIGRKRRTSNKRTFLLLLMIFRCLLAAYALEVKVAMADTMA